MDFNENKLCVYVKMPTSKTSDSSKPRPKSGGNVVKSSKISTKPTKNMLKTGGSSVKSLKSSTEPTKNMVKTGGSPQNLSHSAEKSKKLLKSGTEMVGGKPFDSLRVMTSSKKMAIDKTEYEECQKLKEYAVLIKDKIVYLDTSNIIDHGSFNINDEKITEYEYNTIVRVIDNAINKLKKEENKISINECEHGSQTISSVSMKNNEGYLITYIKNNKQYTIQATFKGKTEGGYNSEYKFEDSNNNQFTVSNDNLKKVCMRVKKG